MGVGFFAMRYQPHTHNHTTSRRQQQANLALRSPQGKLQILGVFSLYRLSFREKHYLCPEKTNAMNSKTHLKAIANPHIQHQRIANSLERGNKDLYDPSLEMNYEYEAKVAKFLMHSEYGYPINVAMNDSFNYTISFLVPNGYDVAFPTAETITSEQFLQKYFEGARIYAEWNRINNYGNSNYRKATLQNPYSLFKLFK